MPLKLYNYKVRTSYFVCIMNVTAWKLKIENIVRDVFILFKIQEKITWNYNSFRKMYPVKGL